MAEIIRMPRLSDTMEEGVIIEWHKKVGDQIAPGDVLAEVETDKATMDLESFDSGTLLYIGVESGAVPVNGILAVIGQAGEDYAELLKSADDVLSAPNETTESTSNNSVSEAPQVSQPATSTQDERIKISPLAKKMASDAGLNLGQINGTGDNGRIVKRDIEKALEQGTTPSPAVGTSFTPSVSGTEKKTVSQMRKTIARRLAESKFSAPHFYLTMKIDMSNTIAARKSINEMIAPEKVSFNDFIVKACAVALKQHPTVNSSWRGDHIIINHDVHLGIAVAVDDGLMVPVVPYTDQLSLTAISATVKDKASRAKSKDLTLDEMQGNTFTISNLGMFGIDEFTAIINPPDACILAVGGIAPTPVVKNGALAVGQIMKVTLSCDHRVVDGASGSRFLQTLKLLLENPVRILA